MKAKLSVPVHVLALTLSFSVPFLALALALPVSGQHGASHGGPMGPVGRSGGFAGHSGLTGSPGFSPPGGITPPIGVAPGHPPYRPGVGDPSHGWDGGDWGRGNKHLGFGFGNPGWRFFPYPYPFLINPGFYDWTRPGDDSTDGQGGTADSYTPYTDYGGAYNTALPEPNYSAEPYPEQQSERVLPPSGSRPRYPGAAVSSTTPETPEPLTLIFKNGRGPEKIQNYIMTADFLTNLDHQRHEKIPLAEIDIAGTEQFNSERGVDFRVPECTHEEGATLKN